MIRAWDTIDRRAEGTEFRFGHDDEPSNPGWYAEVKRGDEVLDSYMCDEEDRDAALAEARLALDDGEPDVAAGQRGALWCGGGTDAYGID